MSAHSPRPWKVDDSDAVAVARKHPEAYAWDVVGPDDARICDVMRIADARLIVTAVNHHPVLIAALKDALAALVKARALNSQGPCDEVIYGNELIASIEAA